MLSWVSVGVIVPCGFYANVEIYAPEAEIYFDWFEV